MKITKEDSRFLVESESQKGKFYTVQENKCTCPAFAFRKSCKHVEAVQKFMQTAGKKDYGRLISFVKEHQPLSLHILLDRFGEELVNDLINRGELYEEKGMVRILA